MKKILLLIVTVLLLGSFIDLQAQAINDWSWSHPRPVGATLRWCQMFDANTYYAFGYYNNFVKTTDAGTTWTSSAPGIRPGTYGSAMTLYNGHFFNMNTGLVCGSYGCVIRTTDAGETWTTINIGSTPTLYGLHFINNNTGFVCGSTSRDISKTTNGGLNWTDISGNISGSTKNCVWALNANTIMVGESSGDVWRTTNGGTNWTEINNPGSTVQAIGFINSNTGFIAGSSKLVMKTTNGGLNWTNFNTGGLPTSYNNFYDVDFASTTVPPTPAVLTATSTNVTILPTGAGGTYWDSVVIGAPLGVITDVQVGVDTLLHTWISDMELTLNSPSGTGVKFFDNRGGSGDNIIHAIFDDSASNPIAGGSAPFTGTWIPDNPLSVFIGDTLKGTWKLKMKDFWYGDGGSMRRWWVKYDYTTFGGTQTSVYVTGNYFAIYKSSITSPSWDTVGFLQYGVQPLTSTYYSTSLAANGDSLLTVGAFGFINKRYNASNRVNFRPDWTWMTSTCNAVGVIGNNTVIIPTSYSAIWRSTNNGVSWDTMKTNTYSGALYSVSTYGNTAWVAGSSGKVNKSTDGGATWAEINDIGSYTLYNANFVDANTGWVVGSSGRCYKTTNGGTNFTQQPISGITSTIYGSSFTDASTGWVVGSSGKVSKTTDGGSTWTAQTSKFSSTLRNIDMVNANTGWMVGYSGCVRGTTNGGTDWDTLQTPYTASLYGVDFVNQWNGMVTGDYGVTYRTRDGGTTWIFERTGGDTQYGVKMTHSDSGWACSSSGYIFRYLETVTGHNTYTHEVPEKYELNQNYPNPFNPTTTIQFALPKAGMVSLKIYDVSGRLVRTLVNNEGLNEGTFKYIFDGSSLASGVYFYSLLVDDNLIDSKKMVLIK